MSGAERFLARWSRRKASGREAAGSAPETPPELPPLDSLGPASDYSVFVGRGVASAVQAAALRVAWRSDPAIANFRGMAEYDWDFNAPGYGALSAADDAGALLARVVRSGPARLIAGDAAPQPPAAPCPAPGAVASEAPTSSCDSTRSFHDRPEPVARGLLTSGGGGSRPLHHAPGSVASEPPTLAAAEPHRSAAHPREPGPSEATPPVVRASRPPAAAPRPPGPVPDLRSGSRPAAAPLGIAADTPPAPALPRRHGGAMPA
jgi:hypothetical protein